MLKGQLKTWNDEKGYGFIKQDNGSPDLFVHISAFQGMCRRPQAGDIVRFQKITDPAGKSRAVNAAIEGVPLAREYLGDRSYESSRIDRDKPKVAALGTRHTIGKMTANRGNGRNRQSSNRMSWLATVLLGLAIFGLGGKLYDRYIESSSTILKATTEAPHLSKPRTNPAFQCQGKTHCSQMGSCAEATFYLQNCPNTEMDGDGDGIPCERQWCN